MKKILLFLFISIMFVSCEKDYLISNKDVPDWLRTDIKHQEQVIKDSPQLMNAYGGWLRYNWQNEYYFEYHNSLSSSSPRAISVNGDTLKIWANDVNTDYYKKNVAKRLFGKHPNSQIFPINNFLLRGVVEFISDLLKIPIHISFTLSIS